MTITYEQTLEFAQDLKKLSKKWRSLPDDLESVKRNVIELLHIHKINPSAIFELTGCDCKTAKAYIVKKFACKSLSGTGSRSGIRITYIYYFEFGKVLFTEMYYKGDKEIEDKNRVLKYLPV